MALEIIDLMRSINRAQGTTVIMVTHDEENAARAADRIVRLRDGRVLNEEAR
jgi:ABC-type lipoprotein export system ATPase subunit